MLKVALLVGINYIGQECSLQGCINDVQNVRKLLLESGYLEQNIVMLTDETPVKPTRQNIIKALVDLILSDAQKMVFHYSGHGSYETDCNGDEKDGRDECLVPLDCDTAGMILDDEIRGILQLVQPHQELFTLMDCCHSGTNMDLAYNLHQRVGRRTMTMVRDSGVSETRGQVVMISGCQDSQYSADAIIDDSAGGAMTCAFLKSYAPGKKYVKLMADMFEFLEKNDYPQVPNLSSGKSLNL
ncbi:caspase family protein, partial [Candidatus Saccharibacteria bacterium]|nr:caspase family protein [Candidatus Saccharibacteria bacterium]